MKLVSESPEEDLLLDHLVKAVQGSGYSLVYGESYVDSFVKDMFAGNIGSDIRNLGCHIDTWTPEQRLWFLTMCEDYVKSDKYREVVNDFQNFIGIYDEIFKEERKAFAEAQKDYVFFLRLENNAHLLHVDNYSKLYRFLDKAVKKGPDCDIRTVSTYYDADINEHVIELNSIKIPIRYEKKVLKHLSVIYGWSDMDFCYSHEFLKYDLLNKKAKYQIEVDGFDTKQKENKEKIALPER